MEGYRKQPTLPDEKYVITGPLIWSEKRSDSSAVINQGETIHACVYELSPGDASSRHVHQIEFPASTNPNSYSQVSIYKYQDNELRDVEFETGIRTLTVNSETDIFDEINWKKISVKVTSENADKIVTDFELHETTDSQGLGGAVLRRVDNCTYSERD